MDRRAFIATGVAGAVGLTGCLGDGGDGGTAGTSNDGGTDGNDGGANGNSGETDGSDTETRDIPDLDAVTDPDPSVTSAGLAPDPKPDAVADIEPADPTTYGRAEYNGIEVPLVPIETARYWYHEQKARFVDARGASQYEQLHVAGAVSSPAQSSLSTGGVEDWSEPTRIVTYCRCPHHLSGVRASELYDAGYEAVFAIDEGFGAWIDRGYPTTSDSDSDLSVAWEVVGMTTPADAGDLAWIRHKPSGQMEANPIGPDGRFSMTLHFSGVDRSSPLTVETPSAELVAPASDLLGRTVDLTE